MASSITCDISEFIAVAGLGVASLLKTEGESSAELDGNSALDSPSVVSKLATPPHAINPNISQGIDDATSATNDTYDDASTLLDNDDVPLGDFLDKQIARTKDIENAEIDEIFESDEMPETKTPKTPTRTSLPRYELPKVPEGYVMNE